MQPLKSLNLILLVRLQKTFIFRKRCDWTIFLEVSRFEYPHCK